MYLLIFLLLHSTALPSPGSAGRITEEENEMLKRSCGAGRLTGTIPKSRGDRKVQLNEFPWIAALKWETRKPLQRGPGGKQKDDDTYIETTFPCSAVQISSRHILTAAHCVIEYEDQFDKFLSCIRKFPYTRISPKDFTIYISSSCEDPLRCENNQTVFKITKPPIIHEEYDYCKVENDVAIIELDSDIPSEVGTPICMLEEGERFASKLTAAGYGIYPPHPKPHNIVFNPLHKIDIDSMHVEESAKCEIEAHLVNNSMCGSDGGGPLFHLNEEERYALVGITFRGNPSCDGPVRDGTSDNELRNVFVNLRCYIDWICKHTGVCPIPSMEPRTQLS